MCSNRTLSYLKNYSKMPEAIAGGSHPPDPVIMTELPTLSLGSITQSPWAEVELLRNCYSCFGRENLLHDDTYSPTQPKVPTSSIPLSFMPCELVINERKSWEDIGKVPNPWDSASSCNNQDLTGCTGFMEIYICYHCEREFTNKDAMRIHQNACSHRPDNQPGMRTPPPPPAPSCSSKKLLSHAGQPVRPVTSLLNEDDSQKSTKEGFLKYFQLVQTHKAEKIKSDKLKLGQNTDVDCQIIDVEPRDSVQQTSPRTPKSLISQLSREVEPGLHRKRLCPTNTEESDGDSGYSTTGNGVEEIDAFKKSSKTNSLLCIDISSLLGLRIQKHVKAETTLQALPDIEQYCKTPEKNDALERLRSRPITYPITFRNSKKINTKYSHEYKFTKAQRKEFMKLVQTGLNKQSRMLKRSLKMCSVRLRRLDEEEIKKWTAPKRDARVNIQPLTHDQILLWTSKRECLKDSQNITSMYPWSPQKFSKSFPPNRQSTPVRRIGYHYYKIGSPVHKKVRKLPHPMTVYKSVYSADSTSKPKSLPGVHQFVPSVKHPLSDSHPFPMRHSAELSRFLTNHHAPPKLDQTSQHYRNPYKPIKSLNTEPISSQPYINLSNSPVTTQFLMKCIPPETQNCPSSSSLMMIPVSGDSSANIAQEQANLEIAANHGLPPSHSVVPNSQEPLKLVIKSQANTPNDLNVNEAGDDNVSIHTISSDSEDDEQTWITRCTICRCGPCQCPPDACFRFPPSHMQSIPHFQVLDHNNPRINDQNINNTNINAVENSPMRVIVNYNKQNQNINYSDSNNYLSNACDQQVSPKHVYAPIIKSVGHLEKQVLKQFHTGSPDICTSSPLKVINRVEQSHNPKHYANDLVGSQPETAVSHNKHFNQQRTKNWHSAYNSNKIRIQRVGQSPRANDLDEDDDIQILEEVICID
ncbi:uncharacterized protein LOC115210189 isoform X2 [Octopus sinensis]|uniref:Uncharacterized protein LOC115210189 isoform X2 n=1 Tax=Octopus sinensis TaxID=2607531 RepID=A0A6P7S8V0_9MOLL|nr:uncharacterized protein LOC115210189 isoform X2 [Octopus sinensis]